VASERRVLVVDDNPFIGRLVRRLLEPTGFGVEVCETGAAALARLGQGFRGVIILDVQLPDAQGPELLPRIREVSTDCPVIFLTGFGTADLALQTLASGAFEFLDKDQDVNHRLLSTVTRAFESLEAVTADVAPHPAQAGAMFAEIITRARAMRAVFQQLRGAVESNVTVLVRGESGTGKEIVARAIHHYGARRAHAFVAVNCAGIPDTLLESEMFGYERGAFTGATQRKKGCFEVAEGGTLFLDEIGEMPTALQAKLLRVIQEGEFQRLGGTQPIRANVRLLSATNCDLERGVQVGSFREDLYYRLGVYTVHLPPLRERSEDVPLLVDHFVREIAAEQGREVKEVEPRVVEVLSGYSFPGNIRELRNICAHAVVSTRGPRVTLADLPQHFLKAATLERRKMARVAPVTTPPAAPSPSAVPLAAAVTTTPSTPATPLSFLTLRELERVHIQAALLRTHGNKAAAAKLLGVSRMTLYRKLEEHEMG
jgi:DNA-binding NtrC family response regulator